MDNKLGDRGTTLDGGTERNAVPMPLAETLSEGVDGTRSLPALSDERKEEIRKMAMRKMQTMESEYWRLRNDKQPYMECPYCGKMNFVDEPLCCALFTKAFDAIMERQSEVDVAASHVRNCHKVGLVH